MWESAGERSREAHLPFHKSFEKPDLPVARSHFRRRSLRVFFFLAVGLSAAMPTPPPAAASFPGRSGAIAFSWCHNTSEDIDGCDVATITKGGRTRFLTDFGYDIHEFGSDWSPGGRWLAYDQDFGTGFELKIVRANGSEDRFLVPSAHSPAWSPNGRRLAFSKGNNTDLFSIRRDGKQLKRIVRTKAGEHSVDWSSRNRLVFARGFGGRSEIWVMRPDGTHQRRLTNNKVFDGEPDWGPGGRRIVFSRFARGHSSIFTMRRNGTHLRRIGPGSQPTWSPDGRLIAFVQEGLPAIYVMAPNGSDGRVLVETPLVYEDPDTGDEFPLSFGPVDLDWRPRPNP